MPHDPGWLERHFKQDASVLGAMLAFGLTTLVVVGIAYADLNLESDSLFALAVVGIPAAGLPGIVVFFWRLLRRTQRVGRCGSCPAAPADEVRYLQVTGLLIAAYLKEARFEACRRCSGEACAKMTMHTAAFGWWSLLTPLVVPWVLLNNLAFYLKNRLATRGVRAAARALEEHRAYAINLLRTKDRGTVVEVLSQKVGCAPADIEAWLRGLSEPGAP